MAEHDVAFPGVWTDWSSGERHGGFDAVIGNPPWDRIKLQQVEWFAARRSEIALAQRASDRKRMIDKLKVTNDPLWTDFSEAESRAVAMARAARTSGQYPLLSGGDTNLNSLFVERAHELVKPDGVVGLLIPSGIASDQSSAAFFRQIASGGQLRLLVDFFNRSQDGSLFFPDVYYRFKFCAYVAGGPKRLSDEARYGFYVRDVSEVSDPDRVFPMTFDDIKAINPNTGTAPIFRSRRDRDLAAAAYRRMPILHDRSELFPRPAWPVRYVRMFDMANDSGQFRTRSELEESEGAWSITGNRFGSSSGEWVPLYEGKMVQAFDHRASDIVVAQANVYRPGQGADLSDADHQNPARLPQPRYWVPEISLPQSAGEWFLGIKDVTSVTNARTTIATILPRVGAGHTLPVLLPTALAANEYADTVALLAANLNSLVYDYFARQKVPGNHLAWFIVEQLPLVPPDAYARRFGPLTAAEIVRAAVLELSYTAHDLAPFARDLGHLDADGRVLPPFAWDEERRLHLRARLDALYFILYGVTDRDDVRHVFSTFPIVEREQQARWGRHRHRDLTLAWINALLAGRPDADVTG